MKSHERTLLASFLISVTTLVIVCFLFFRDGKFYRYAADYLVQQQETQCAREQEEKYKKRSAMAFPPLQLLEAEEDSEMPLELIRLRPRHGATKQNRLHLQARLQRLESCFDNIKRAQNNDFALKRLEHRIHNL